MNEFPDFYEPQRIGTLHYPDTLAIASAASEAGMRPAAEDTRKVHLLIVDMQVDFCHEQGALYVPGALEDMRRLCEFIFRRGHSITDITCTLDSHLPFQIFHAAWWADADGNHPGPLTIISLDDVENGRWRPLVMPEFSREYVRKLEEGAKKQLVIWPYHVLIGGPGNALDPELWSVVMWHSFARKTQPSWLFKGRVPQSEYYSALQPEVDVPEHPQGTLRTEVLETLTESDIVLVAGEAKSHCVLETLEDLVAQFGDRPELLRKFHVLEDCMSPVAHPEVDFEAIANEAFEAFADAGINLVKSTDELSFLASEVERQAIEEPVPVSGLQRMGEWAGERIGEQ